MKPYICPMHPDVTSDRPGSCPKCGMKLEQREEGPSTVGDRSGKKQPERER